MKKIILSAIVLSLGIIGFTSCSDELDSQSNDQIKNEKTAVLKTGLFINVNKPCNYSKKGNCLPEVTIRGLADADRVLLDHFRLSLDGDYKLFVENNLQGLSRIFLDEDLNSVIEGNMTIEYYKNEDGLEFFIFKIGEEVISAYPFV